MKLNIYSFVAAATLLSFSLTGCETYSDPSTGDDNGSTNPSGTRQYFNLAVGIDVESSTGATYVAAYNSLSSPELNISFNGWGYEVPSVRTARVYAANDGKTLYNLSYGGGTISKFSVFGGQSYSEDKVLDISLAMGTNNPRWTKVSEQHALLHNVTTKHQFDGDNYTYTNTTGILTAIDLPSFSIITDYNPTGGATFNFPRTEEDDRLNLHVWRIDAPVVLNGKAYYGLNKRIYDANTDTNISTSDYSASTLVVDFPSLQNPKIITSAVAKGSTQGYRTPVAHADEKNDIYQVTAAPSHIVKIANGDYDDSYDFNLSTALGMNVGTNGWFYVGNGIGYLPFYDADLGNGSDVAAWGVARIDLYSKTAVRMNLPANLWLQQYQYGVLGNDGLFYMALAPLGGEGKIYMFDPSNTSADGFTTGATIQPINRTSAYLGIF